MMTGLVLEAYGQKNSEPILGTGSGLVLVALTIFAVNLLGNDRLDQP